MPCLGGQLEAAEGQARAQACAGLWAMCGGALSHTRGLQGRMCHFQDSPYTRLPPRESCPFSAPESLGRAVPSVLSFGLQPMSPPARRIMRDWGKPQATEPLKCAPGPQPEREQLVRIREEGSEGRASRRGLQGPNRQSALWEVVWGDSAFAELPFTSLCVRA